MTSKNVSKKGKGRVMKWQLHNLGNFALLVAVRIESISPMAANSTCCILSSAATRIIADTVSCNNKSNSVMIFIIIRTTFFNIIVYNIHTIIIFLKKFYGTKNNGISAFIPDKAGKQLDILSWNSSCNIIWTLYITASLIAQVLLNKHLARYSPIKWVIPNCSENSLQWLLKSKKRNFFRGCSDK